MRNNHTVLLTQFDCFSYKPLDDTLLDALYGTLKERHLEVGDTLFEKGNTGDSMGFVVRGKLRVTLDKDDPKKTIAYLSSGDIVGEMSCVDPQPRSAAVIATERTVVLELSRTMLHALQQNAQPIAVAIQRGIIAQLTRRLRDTNRAIELKIEDGPARVPNEAPSAKFQESPSGADTSDRVDLKSLECLQGFTNEELKTLIQHAPPQTYPADHALLREGSGGDLCAILASGSLEVIRRIGGQPRVLAVLKPGTIVGQLALVDQTPRSATVRVREKSIILCLKREAFETLLAENNPMAIRFQHQIAVAGARQLRLANAKLNEVAEQHQAASPVVETENPELSHDQFFWNYMQTALGEWGVSVSELDQMRASRPDGQMSAQEMRARMRNK